MAKVKNLKAFTIRIPETLLEMIEHRAGVHHRSRNSEVIALLEKAIDETVSRDLKASGPR